MPCSPVRFLVDTALHVTACVAALGIATCLLAGLPWVDVLPVWLLGTFAVYAVHKVMLRRVRGRVAGVLLVLLAAGSLCGLLVYCVTRGDWVALGGVGLALLAGGVYSYDLPLSMSPMRQLPLLKTLLPWAVAAAALALLPLHDAGWRADQPFRVAAAWTWMLALLLANLLWCDLRDVRGDLAHGVVSVPGLLGGSGTRRLIAALCLIALGAGVLASESRVHLAVAVTGALGVGALAVLNPAPMSRVASEFLVEGVLLLPVLPAAAAGFAGFLLRPC